MDTSIFFPVIGGNARKAIKVCETCEIRTDCLEQFIDEPHGVFGGKTVDQRQAIRVERLSLSHRPVTLAG